MHPVEKVLGFRVNQMRGQVETLDASGEVRAVRPATERESALWSEVMENYAARQSAIQASADLKSVVASNEAYREELNKLRSLAEDHWVSPALPPANVPTADMFEEIMLSHKRQKQRLLDKAREIWQIDPGVDIIDFIFRQLQHINGEMAAETERRRMEHVARPLTQFAEDMQSKIAGEQVQK